MLFDVLIERIFHLIVICRVNDFITPEVDNDYARDKQDHIGKYEIEHDVCEYSHNLPGVGVDCWGGGCIGDDQGTVGLEHDIRVARQRAIYRHAIFGERISGGITHVTFEVHTRIIVERKRGRTNSNSRWGVRAPGGSDACTNNTSRSCDGPGGGDGRNTRNRVSLHV